MRAWGPTYLPLYGPKPALHAAPCTRRYWLVTDAEMDTQEVRGHGLSGWRPILAPGEWISYRASCLLRTPAGSMEGHLEMWTRSTGSVGGEGAWEYPFRAEIGQFGLNSGLAQGVEPSRPEA